MALINRKNKTDVPQEIQEYYQTEKRERAGVAWLLAFGTLIVTIVLAAGIFFAGRWAYREIAGTDDNGAETTEVAQDEDQGQEGQPADGGDEGAAEDEFDSQDTGDDQVADDQTTDDQATGVDELPSGQGQVDDQAATTDEPSGNVAGDTDGQQVAVAGESIPDTGPGDTAAIFLAVSILGYAIHRAYSLKASE